MSLINGIETIRETSTHTLGASPTEHTLRKWKFAEMRKKSVREKENLIKKRSEEGYTKELYV